MYKKYLIFLPKVQGSIEEEWRQCLDQVKGLNLPGYRIIKLNIFVDVPDFLTYTKVKKEIGESVLNTSGDMCPAFNVTVHSPEKPWKVVVEAGLINTSDVEVISKFLHAVPYVVMLTESRKEIWAGGLGNNLFPDEIRSAAKAAFEQMKAILDAEEMSFDNVVRQWNYIGNILEENQEIQNYQIFNEVRSETYHKFRNVHSYPAATGVGMKTGGVYLDFCAVKAERNLKIIAIDNPDQIRPYDYSQQVLKGKPAGGKAVNQPPQFERAVFLVDTRSSTLFVSGTASIIGQDTIGINDAGRQTIVTIENIEKLSDAKRIAHLTGKPDNNAGSLILLRVYIKRQADFEKVKSICDEFHPGVPAVFIEADICRDNLLVEIEAEFSKGN